MEFGILMLSRFYGTPFHVLQHYDVGKLAKMTSAMTKIRAKERLYHAEENAFPHWKEETRDSFLKVLYKQMGERYSKGREVTEEELKGIFGNGGHNISTSI